jgi:hypothetical protein
MARGGGLREALREVAQSASNVARLQAELSRSDLKQTSALGLGAAVFGVLAFLLLTTLFVIALAIPLPAWLAILIVMLVYMAIAAALGAAYRHARVNSVARQQARVTSATLKRISGKGAPAPPPVAPPPAGPGSPTTP